MSPPDTFPDSATEHMDLAEFLDENDQRTILNGVLGGLTPGQKAHVIKRSIWTTLAEKHFAWQSIIDTLPDEMIEIKDFITELPKTGNLHRVLQDYMSEQKNLEADFFRTEPDVVYMIDLSVCDTGESLPQSEPCLSWDACAKEIMASINCFRDKGRLHTEVTKYYPKVYVNSFIKQITAEFNEVGSLMDIYSRMMMTVPSFGEAFDFMLGLPKVDAWYQSIPLRQWEILRIQPGAKQQFGELSNLPLLLTNKPQPGEGAFVYSVGGAETKPRIDCIDPKYLCRYTGSKTTTSYLLLREIAEAMEHKASMYELNQRIGAALTYPFAVMLNGTMKQDWEIVSKES